MNIERPPIQTQNQGFGLRHTHTHTHTHITPDAHRTNTLRITAAERSKCDREEGGTTAPQNYFFLVAERDRVAVFVRVGEFVEVRVLVGDRLHEQIANERIIVKNNTTAARMHYVYTRIQINIYIHTYNYNYTVHRWYIHAGSNVHVRIYY